MRTVKLLFIIVLPLFLLVACTNSRLVLRPLYNSLDDRIQKSLLGYTDFSSLQNAEVEDLIDHFHVWHRQTQMPHYAALASTVADRLSLDEPITRESVEFWSQSLRIHSDTIGRCNPMYVSDQILAGLDDLQVAEMSEKRQEILAERRSDDTVDFEGGSAGEDLDEVAEPGKDREIERKKRQAKNATRIRRYIELAGLEVTDKQFQDYKATQAKQIHPKTRFREILYEWDARFFELLKQRQESNWPDLLRDYVDARRTAFSARRVDVRAHNTKLWEDYAVRTFNDLSPEQRTFVSNWLAKLSTTLSSLAADAPSYTGAKAEDYECRGVKILG